MNTKAALRSSYLSKRKSFSSNQVEEWSRKIADKFILQFNPTENEKIHCFIPMESQNEVNTFFLIRYCFENNIRVFVPKVKGRGLISVEIHPNTQWERSSWGILEPKAADASLENDFDYIITPLVYCDPLGNRVGYGKGFYDGLFTSLSPSTVKVGVGFFPPKEMISDLRPEDIPVDYLIIPSSVFSFKIG